MAKRITLIATVAVVAVAWGVNAFWNSDSAVISRADPAMISLADKALMTTSAKAEFLRNDPEVVTNEQLHQSCGEIFGEDVGFGCYLPEGKIYIRDMPTEFNYYEASIAAHEMLHAIYAKEEIDSEISSSLELAYLTHAEDLANTMESYTDLEGAERESEIHSIMPTETKFKNSILEQYYNRFFIDQPGVVDVHLQVEEDFAKLEANLETRDKQISNLEKQTESLYSSHTAAADNGDAVNADYYYNLYSQAIDDMNDMIDQYNLELDKYNAVVEGFNGEKIEAKDNI